MSPRLFLILACLKLPLRDNIQKNLGGGVTEEGAIHLQ
jgi:hypothetical protein